MSEGYALRRKKSCMDYETDCGTTWKDFVACCPSDSYCPRGESTTVCRKSHVGSAPDQCANGTWNLFHANDFFCCDQGELAIKTVNTRNSDTDGYVGCFHQPLQVRPPYHLSQLFQLPQVSNTHTAEPTPSQSTNPSPPSSSTNTGAIAGGVVGGVAGAAILAALVWFLARRSKAEKLKSPTSAQGAWGMQTVGNSSKFQQSPVQELDAGLGPTPPVYELPDATSNRQ
ncbi:hypothetical protein BDV41DRAFT_574107 [Aspergillus transmontanensis]|uniref:Uncharacterized protein n=1 Tax=Aspergillus transmontanensis TaxID=1034304 RepID=A0A5N6W5H6_9EURO|nr:hypothetical protein BDV41DRAFT_574107 [Aspergillus transmontanensis]